MTTDLPESRTLGVLVTGATGYIGGRLVPVLEGSGVRLRCLARRPAVLESRVAKTTDVVEGDLFDPASHTVTAQPNSLGGRDGGTMLLLGNGKVLSAGGSVPSAELFSPPR